MRRQPTLPDLLRRFVRARRGATAVEFALVVGPLLALIMAILEVSLIFFAGTMIENAVNETAREIRTGRLQTEGGDEESFRSDVCRQLAGLIDCGRLRIDVRTYENFDAADFSNPINSDGEIDDGGFGFAPGGSSDIVVVRAFYPWQMFTPDIGLGMSNLRGNQRLIAAATAFRNEPFRE